MSVSVYIPGVVEDELEWNVANDNFKALMGLLGYEMTPHDMVGAFEGIALARLRSDVVFALDSIAAMPDIDGGLVPVDLSLPGRATVIDFGLRPGYFKDRLTGLLRLIDVAIDTDKPLRYS